MLLKFADVELDLDRMHLERSGEEVPIEPQVFDVLAYLVRHRERMVPKSELLDEIWGGRFVSESALTSRIKSARRAIGDNGRDQRLIRTVHGRGFRFVGEVVTQLVGEDGGPVESVVSTAAPSAASLAADVVASLHAGRGTVVEIVGPSGRARADLLDEVAGAAADAGLLVGRGSGAAMRRLGGILEGFDEWVHRRPELLDRVPTGCAVELRRVLDGEEPSTPQRLNLACRELVVAAGATGGAVLAIDDVHLIDRSTMGLLEQLARGLRRAPVAIVVTHTAGFMVTDRSLEVDVTDRADGSAPENRVPVEIRPSLARVAVVGESFSELEFEAASGLESDAARRALDIAVGAGVLVTGPSGYRFVDADLVAALDAEVPPWSRTDVVRTVAARLSTEGADPARTVDLLLRAGDLGAAAPYLVAAATAAASGQMHSEVLRHTARVDDVADATLRFELLALRAEALAGVGSSEAIGRYREAVRLAPADRVAWLRARLARALLFEGDVEGAAETLEGLEPDGSAANADIMMSQGMLAYFQGDLERAEALADTGRAGALMLGASSQMLSAISLQGMIAHSRGEWFDRLRRELRFAGESNELVTTVFDAHACVAQYLLYGPEGHDDVVRMADELHEAAIKMGSPRAAGFSRTLAGEAKLLAGDLEGARVDLSESLRIHTEIGAETGRAHAMQRLADVELADGNRGEAERLCRAALPIARWSPLSHHLLQRTYGTLIAASPDHDTAVAVVEEARRTLDAANVCNLCQVMVSVPIVSVLAADGRFDEAENELVIADRSASSWDGPAWPAAVDEARASVAAARGDRTQAERLLRLAAAGFEAAHQPIDAARCLETLDD